MSDDRNDRAARGRRTALSVGDVVAAVGGRVPPAIAVEASVEDAVMAFERHRHTRVLYVVDAEGVLVGVLTVGTLMRHVHGHGRRQQVHPRRVLGFLTGETVGDVMHPHPVGVTADDSTDTAVRRMTDAGAKELPVVDAAGHLVADITIVDVLYHSLAPGSEGGGEDA